jgi:ArsR family transcriptional regulator
MKQEYHDFKAEFFKTLAHPVRLEILDHLRSGEKNVSELQALLDLDQSTVSQQLARLRRSNIVGSRKQGTVVYYTVQDPTIFDLLDVAQEIFSNHVIGTQTILDARRKTRSTGDS